VQTQRRQPESNLGPWTIAAAVAVVLIALAGFGYAAIHQSSSPAATPTAESLAPAVDGVQCSPGEQIVYHIHQYLALYDHGKQIDVPSSIGIPGGEQHALCLYWIHVHALYPNIIHIESPVQKTYKLGTFFDIWKATRATTVPPGDAYVLKLEAAARHGQVHAFVDGKPWHGSYRSIPLTEHAVITIEIGTPVVPPKPYTHWNGL
jgi:hypothetical protein